MGVSRNVCVLWFALFFHLLNSASRCDPFPIELLDCPGAIAGLDGKINAPSFRSTDPSLNRSPLNESDAARLARAEKLFHLFRQVPPDASGAEVFTPAQRDAILAAHAAPTLAEKARLLNGPGLFPSAHQRRILIANQVCGQPELKDFVRELRATGADPSNQIILADWLEEKGAEAAARSLRIEWEIALLPEGDPEVAVLEKELKELRKSNKAYWLKGMPEAVAKSVKLLYSIPWEASLSTAQAEKFAPALIEQGVRDLTLKEPTEDGVYYVYTWLESVPSINEITTLRLAVPRFSQTEMARVGATSALQGVHTLEIRGNKHQWEQILNGLASGAPNLEHLVLGGGDSFNPGRKKFPVLKRISALTLKHSSINVSQLVKQGPLTNISELRLNQRMETTQLSAWGTLAQKFPNLKKLTLPGLTSYSNQEARFFDPQILGKLEELDTSNYTTHVERIGELIQSPALAKLRTFACQLADAERFFGDARGSGMARALLAHEERKMAAARAVLNHPNLKEATLYADLTPGQVTELEALAHTKHILLSIKSLDQIAAPSTILEEGLY